jgi:hypothetical protein
MKWKFWDKAPPNPKPIAWPSGTHESVKYVVGFYSMAGSLPFREWKSPLVDVKPNLESTVQLAVRALQTRFYFGLLERRIGVLEAEIAKDGFLSLLTRLSDDTEGDLGAMTRFLLLMIDDAANTAEHAGEKVVPTPSGDVVVPPEYFMALHLLVRMPDSPYFNVEADADFDKDDWTLAECLVHGKTAAKGFFTPMIDAITEFDPGQFPEWTWRKRPGAHERHLQRRHNNLLFPAARRVVTTSAVLDARRKDDSELRDLRDRCNAIELPDELPLNWSDFLSDIREQIDELKARARQIGGDTSRIIDYLNNTRSDMANVWKAGMKGNEEGLRLYETAEAAAREHDELFRGDFGHQLLREDTCIPPDEIAAALLSEDAKTVAAFYDAIPEEQQNATRRWASEIVKHARAEGFDLMTIKDQLYALGWPRASPDGSSNAP